MQNTTLLNNSEKRGNKLNNCQLNEEKYKLMASIDHANNIKWLHKLCSWDDETRTTLSFDEKYTHDSKG